MPFEARADVLSSFFGNTVSASGEPLDPNQNSQNLGLLQANALSAFSLSAGKKEKDSNNINENANVNILSENALMPVAPSLNGTDPNSSGDPLSDQISVYVVRKGDSIADIAKMFNVSSNTVLWANGMKKGDKLTEGDILLILPVSGVKHVVSKGQTLKGIAKKYGADLTDVAGFNGIAEDAELAVGDELIIPDGTMADEGGDKPIKNTKKSNYYDTHKLASFSNYYINPMPEARMTQGLHDRGGIDLAAPLGTPVYAAAAGTVTFARDGYNGGYGNLVIIQHANGTQTLYGHLHKIITSVGQKVSQGEKIGLEGNTGRSTGPHLHFVVRGAKNPGAFVKIGSTPNANWK